jgi:benzil reductase ((S)-benzoin forming)
MRIAIVTGGSRGLGHALCEQLSTEGYEVIEFSRTAPHPYSVSTDLSDPQRSRETVRRALLTRKRDACDGLVVIHNAGMLTPIGPAASKSDAAVLANINTNFVSALLVLTEVMAAFQSTPCRKVIANISSGAAQKGYAGWSLYCAAKAGVENYIRALALEQQAQSHPFVAINVDPGVMDTAMQAEIRASSVADFPQLQRFVQRQADGELVAPDVVAQAVLRIMAEPALVSGERYAVSDYFAAL